MSTARQYNPITVQDYLESESSGTTKHEYVDGRVYAMAGASNVHNRIASRVLGALYQQLANASCEAYNSDTKIRVCAQQRTYFYYPDASVVCQSNPDKDTYQDQPVVIVEVISESTRRIDEGEKLDRYLTIDSLDTYVLLEQVKHEARVFQRDGGQFRESIFSEVNSVVPLPKVGAVLDLAEIYVGIQFPMSE